MEKVPSVQVAAPNPVTSSPAEAGVTDGIPKWVIAAAIGVPVAAALAYILFGPSSDSDTKSIKKKKKKAEVKASESEVKATPKPVVTKVNSTPKDEVIELVLFECRRVSRCFLCREFRLRMWRTSRRIRWRRPRPPRIEE